MDASQALSPLTALTTPDLVRNRLQSALEALSPGTRRQYGLALSRFAEYSAGQMGLDVGRSWWAVIITLVDEGPLMTGHVVDLFRKHACHRAAPPHQPLAPATVAQRLAAIGWVLGVLNEMQIITWTIRIRGPKPTTYRDTTGPTMAIVQRLIATADEQPGLLGRRDAVLTRLLFALALRRAECVTLTVGAWLRDQGKLAVKGKGRDDVELVTVPDRVGRSIDAYLNARGYLAPEAPLLVGHGRFSDPSEALSDSGVYRALARLSRRAGVAQIRPHGLRHRAVTQALDETNGDVRSVAAFARHRNVATTLKYDDARRDVGGAVAGVLAGLADQIAK